LLVKLTIFFALLIILVKLLQTIKFPFRKKNIKNKNFRNKKINIDTEFVQDADFEELEK
tara:strand:- start:1657 stop:1833 length:177 start_codon:yes stop_codon:yes gene_type:complete